MFALSILRTGRTRDRSFLIIKEKPFAGPPSDRNRKVRRSPDESHAGIGKPNVWEALPD